MNRSYDGRGLPPSSLCSGFHVPWGLRVMATYRSEAVIREQRPGDHRCTRERNVATAQRVTEEQECED